ncbi:MAG: hypothetical protein AAF152_03715 [Cyanobacteria bacterium P01_A01_bin.114]
MLVIVMKNRLLPPGTVCQSCLMADQSGQPRWQNGQLRCGRLLETCAPEGPVQYECTMGFRVAEVSV